MPLSTFLQNLPSAPVIVVPIHLLTYSTLLGTSLYQTFIITKVAYQALPRSAFTTLQKRLFPIYFRSQSLLLVLTAITYPPYGPASLAKVKGDWITFVIAGITAGLNLMVYGPRTSRAMVERIQQATKDARAGGEGDGKDEISKEMTVRNRVFSRNHAMSIHLNLLTIGAMVWYGVRLAGRLAGRLEVGV
ncbi:hypothetical protein K491DRAFT_668008 [Lophiostoma macrostomum CBS 122681]|uniref:TMEM205-like domain-containing protein n=1 Tax=Lophiostoma macrostomum CBS 122681 TaxID=1314788 RepID=A0A6A6SUU7_9PLEO|nr:hypothetical protein K491DRAFT_668008 [Lophiostoma macrostomum CBS 122681]